MSNSLLDITPHQVSRDLRGYSVLFYGTPKSGKTTVASKFPNALILAFEKGYSAIPGIMAKPLNSWGEFKKVLSELKSPAVQERFSTIVIDTADIAYTYCERYICSLEEDKESIGDFPYGKGYSLLMNEFDGSLRKILQMNYGLVIISHSQDKTFKNAEGEEYDQIIPTLDKRGRLICERTCDIIGYSTTVNIDGKVSTRLYMRSTPRFVAGSRFRFTPDYIEFSYDNLVEAIANAIDEEAKFTGEKYIKDERNILYPSYDFEAMMNEFNGHVKRLMDQNINNAAKVSTIIEVHLGKDKKVSSCTADQAPQLDLILSDLRRL